MLYGYRKLYSPCVNRWCLQGIAEDVETRFDTSNYETDKPLPKEKNRNVIGIVKDGLEGQIMKESVGLIAKTFGYEKPKDTKKCIIKRKPKFQDYKGCLRAAQIENIINYLEKKKLMQIVFKKNS